MDNFFPQAMQNQFPSQGAQSWYSPQPVNFTNNVNTGPSTNVSKVASLEEGIFKSNVRPSENVYFHQSKPEFYNIRVDINGNKSWQTFSYAVSGDASVTPVSRADFDSLEARVKALEPKEEVAKDA